MTTPDVSSWLPNLLGPLDLQVGGVASNVPRRSTINLIGASIADDTVNGRTNITFPVVDSARATISDVGDLNDIVRDGAILFTVAPIGPGLITVSGFVAPTDARSIIVYAQGRAITLKHQTGSAAANQISLLGAADLPVALGTAVQLTYDPTLAKWFLSAVTSSTSSTTPGGAVGSLQFHDTGGVFNGLSSVTNNAGNISIAESAPVVDGAGKVTIACVNRAGRSVIALGDVWATSWARATGGISIVGPHPGHTQQSYAQCAGVNVASLNVAGAQFTFQGTNTPRVLASTNLATSLVRLGYVSSGFAGSFASVYESDGAKFWRGNAAGLGGFYIVERFAITDPANVTGARMFAGLHTSVATATNVEPNTLTSLVGVCQLSSSSNLHLIHNDGAGTATTVNLGASFPANGSSDVYELTLWAPPNQAFIGYRVERVNTGDVAEGTLSTDLPPNTTFLARRLWRTNNANSLAVAVDMVKFYGETLV
jgi:hypothetical protein